ncbi:MAG: hypothetical protein U9R68_08520 [Planctomycetota bacterium]|nr:hypothetical protein [Planctomycetota bacterium]
MTPASDDTVRAGAAPPGGFVLRLPKALGARVRIKGEEIDSQDGRDYRLPAAAERVRIDLAPEP